MAALHGGRRDKLEVSPNLWAGVGLVRGGAGTALVGDPETVAARMKEYMALGIDTFILSGYPHLEEAYRFAELVFPLLPLGARQRRREPARQHRPVRRDHRQRDRPRNGRRRPIMSDAASARGCRHGRRPAAWALPVALLVAIWELALASRLHSRGSCRRRATWRWPSGSTLR